MRVVFKSLLSLLFIVMLTSKVCAQDIMLSQFDAAPLYYNPALAGKIEEQGIGRVIFNGRSQWSTYNTFLLSYDQLIPDLEILGGKIGVGGMINADYAGETSYGNTQFKLIPAFHKSVGNFWFSTGFDIIFNYNSFNVDEAKTKEPLDLAKESQFYADLDWGINVATQIQQKYPLNAGFTFSRILGSGGSLIGEEENYRRFSLNTNAIVDVASQIALKPSMIFQCQKEYLELNFGSYVRFDITAYTKAVKNVYLGCWHRVNDALIFGLAFDFPGFTKNDAINFGISYDFTVGEYRESNFWNTSNNVSKDGVEISIKYIFKKNDFVFKPGGIINEPVM